MDQKVTLGYWAFRGKGQIPRLLLAYTGAVWEDIQYTDRAQWFETDKHKLGLQFPNLPYLIEGDYKLTEADAIVRYIVSRSNKKELMGENPKDEGKINQLMSVMIDIHKIMGSMFMAQTSEEKKLENQAKIEAKLQQIDDCYGEKPFALGYLTLADFNNSESSFYLEKMFPNIYNKYGFLKRVREAVENLPEIKKYYEQESAIKGPLFVIPNEPIVKS